MRLSHLARLTVTTLLGAHVLIHGLACSDSSDDPGGQSGAAGAPTEQIDVSDLRYEGGPTDETARSLLGVTATVDDTRAPRVSAPTEGQALPAATPFTFTWPASTASLGPSLRLSPAHRGPSLPAWLGPERSAHAHGEPYTGLAYLLIFSTADNPSLMRVLTSKTDYTPDTSSWSLLKTASGPITVHLTVARTESNLVVAGGGPFTSATGVTFTIAP